MPQVSGINIAESISITFFALTIFNVLILIYFYEIVSYGISSAIWCFRLVAILYGLVIIALAICAIVLEDQEMDSIGDQVWARLSTNQKDFFSNDVDTSGKDHANDCPTSFPGSLVLPVR